VAERRRYRIASGMQAVDGFSLHCGADEGGGVPG